jgi:hypothetical protein
MNLKQIEVGHGSSQLGIVPDRTGRFPEGARLLPAHEGLENGLGGVHAEGWPAQSVHLRPRNLENITPAVLIHAIMPEIPRPNAEIGDKHEFRQVLSGNRRPEFRQGDDVEWAV